MSDGGNHSKTAVILTAVAGLIAALATAAGVVVSALNNETAGSRATQPSSTSTPESAAAAETPSTEGPVTLDQWVAEASRKCVELEQRSSQMEVAVGEALAALEAGDTEQAVDVVHQTVVRMKDGYAELARIPAPAQYQGEISEAIRLASMSFDFADDAIASAVVNDESGFIRAQQSSVSAQGQAAAIFGRLGARACGSG